MNVALPGARRLRRFNAGMLKGCNSATAHLGDSRDQRNGQSHLASLGKLTACSSRPTWTTHFGATLATILSPSGNLCRIRRMPLGNDSTGLYRWIEQGSLSRSILLPCRSVEPILDFPLVPQRPSDGFWTSLW